MSTSKDLSVVNNVHELLRTFFGIRLYIPMSVERRTYSYLGVLRPSLLTIQFQTSSARPVIVTHWFDNCVNYT